MAGCATDNDPGSGTSHRRGASFAPPSRSRLPIIALTVRPGAPPSLIPRSFLGLSTEYWTLAIDERHAGLYRRVLSMLHVRGDGPLVLRIGGDSSDHALYDAPRLRTPRWAFALTRRFAMRTAGIVKALHLRVILDLNLLTAPPASDAAWVTGPARAQRRAGRPPHRVQLGHLRRAAWRERHVRYGAVGARCDLRADTGRRERSEPARPRPCGHAPFTFGAHGLLARPLLYGLSMFARALGPGAQLVPVDLHGPPSLDLKAWAVKLRGNRLHVLLIDKGPRAAVLRLKIRAS